MPYGLTAGFIDRLRERINQMWGEDGDSIATDARAVGPADDIDTIMYRIRAAGRMHTLLYMKYNNTWRHVEPYSFRYRSKGMQPLFYGYCRLHDTIEAYRIDRIQDVQLTDRPYSPRWEVEIA